jgi:hypothetical protein
LKNILNLSQPESSDKKPSARTLRRIANADTNEFVIKCGLDKSIKVNSVKDDLHKELHKRMIEISRAPSCWTFGQCIYPKMYPKYLQSIGYQNPNRIVRK